MAAGKPQIRSLFATPLSIHFLPVAQDVNAQLRPLIVERAGTTGGQAGQGWRSDADVASWAGEPVQTLFRVLRDMADGLTATRSGGRVTLDASQWSSSALGKSQRPVTLVQGTVPSATIS